MARAGEAWPQDDAGARAALLAWLEGDLELAQAADRYAACFPPVAGMDARKIERTWSRWSPARRRDLARQIRLAMRPAEEAEGDSEAPARARTERRGSPSISS